MPSRRVFHPDRASGGQGIALAHFREDVFFNREPFSRGINVFRCLTNCAMQRRQVKRERQPRRDRIGFGVHGNSSPQGKLVRASSFSFLWSGLPFAGDISPAPVPLLTSPPYSHRRPLAARMRSHPYGKLYPACLINRSFVRLKRPLVMLATSLVPSRRIGPVSYTHLTLPTNISSSSTGTLNLKQDGATNSTTCSVPVVRRKEIRSTKSWEFHDIGDTAASE